jgi:SWI/SNF-related matrix-associated actin-dependent regulator 1 of chromatin subfamily A
VCPATIKSQWQSYVNEFEINAKITSYEFFREHYNEFSHNFIIFDEAHKLKNHKTKIYKLVNALKRRFYLLLTGTPFQNEPLELVNLIKLIRCNYHIVNVAATWVEFPWGKQYVWVKSGLHLLKRELIKQPWFLRRELQDVSSFLPTITREIVVPDNVAWERILKDVDELIEGERNDKNGYRIDLIKAGMFDDVGVLFNVLPLIRRVLGEAKALFAAKYISEIAIDTGEQMLVFTHHGDVRDIIARELAKNKINFNIIEGETTQPQRAIKIDAFKRGDVQILILSTRAAGEGLTLSNAERSIFVELDYNPAVLWQAENRIILPNENKNKIITYIIAPHPLEQQMVRLVNKKANAIQEIYAKDVTVIK